MENVAKIFQDFKNWTFHIIQMLEESGMADIIRVNFKLYQAKTYYHLSTEMV